MGKLASQSFERTDSTQSGAQKALAFYNSNQNDFHPAVRALTGIHLNRYISAFSVEFIVAEANQFSEIRIVAPNEFVKISYDGNDIYITTTPHLP